ncbi:MAG: gyrase subunit A protein [candidate division WS6 bacterium GW2011_GWA2_37_6]|uniref:DNA gyrase subunit A n=1 Tax=candidate division WS6 bacterium GW2011_GWA2_37_6 TaxID=1619087 RepID=A0A0G0K1J4_9BACT|nr:MAG: gyrase subunit A protein [candidate division WS6 bacterium GW2011_GWA2_37_6]
MAEQLNLQDSTAKRFDKIRERNIVDEMKTSYINYAMSVIVARALPDVRDGLKPVQRRILYSMFKLGILPSKGYKKSARTIGDVIAKYHPHGDVAVYDAMVRMAQDFNLRYPLIDPQGNFGSIDGDSPAAMRYTEAKLGKISMEMLDEINEETVDFIPNYDGNTVEPTLLPSKTPNLLLNGADGIAVGMATKIPPHNLGELIDAITNIIKTGNKYENGEKTQKDYFNDIHTVEDLKKLSKDRLPHFRTELSAQDLYEFIPGPDFPTGGVIYDKNEIINMYASGRGRVVTRAVARIEENKGGKYQIIVTEIPYQVNKARLVTKIADLVKDKKIKGIADLRDESSREGMRIVVEIKRDGKPKTILNKLYKFTEMQKAFNSNMIALVDGEPQLLSLPRILEQFIQFRQEVVIRRSEFRLAKAREREHILEGLMIALDNLDAVIKTIRESKDAETAKVSLMTKFKLTEIQSVAILDMQLRKLAALERQKIEDEYKQIKATIKELIIIISTPARVLEIVTDELAEIKEKFSDERRTKVIKGKVDEFSEEDLVASEEVIVTVSEQGYIKRMKENVYSMQHRGGKGKKGMTTKEGDAVAHVFSCNTHDDILFFTNKGRVFLQKVYEIPEFGRGAKGQAIINLINIDQDELITSILTKSKEGKILDEDTLQEEIKLEKKVAAKDYKFLFFATKQGTIKKTALEDFLNIKSNGLIAIKLSAEDELVWVKPTTGESEVILVTKNARSIHFHEKDVRETGRATMGVRGIRLKGAEDYVISMDVIRLTEDFMLTVSENGFGKITKLKQYGIQGRGGQGIYAARINAKTGKLAAARILDHPGMELLIMSEKGQAVKIPTDELPQRNRQTAGVKLMNIHKEDKVAALAVI